MLDCGRSNELQSCRGFLEVVWGSTLELVRHRVPSPNFVDGRVNKQFENEGSEDAADHGCGNAFHDVGTGSCGPHDGEQSDAGGGKGHELRTQALGSALNNRFTEVP